MKSAKDILKDADALLITAGAGMGVDSGLPDFRGVEGFWREYPIIKELNLRFEEMANPKWFTKDPQLAWAFYGHRLNLYRETKPHSGFYKLLEVAKSKKGGYFVFTSNVDGQFQKAGYDKDKIIEVHGSILRMQCSNNCTGNIWDTPKTHIDIDHSTFKAKEPLPTCPTCKAIARPNIMMFSDYNFISDKTDIQANKLQLWLDQVVASDLSLAILEFGAGEAVPTVRIFSENIAKMPKATLIRVNPRESKVPSGNISISKGAKEAIDNLI